MDIAEKTRRINARWDEINPKSGSGSLTKKEREALPSLLADDELPERILAATPGKGFKGLMVMDVLLVATDRQVLCITTKETVRLAYPDIKSVALAHGGFLEIVGPHNKWSVHTPNRQEAERFVSYVQGHLGNSDALPSPTLDQQEGYLASTPKQETSIGSAKPPKWAWAIGISLLLLLIVSILRPGDDAQPSRQISPAERNLWQLSAVGQSACRHWFNVNNDIAQGLLTWDEMRQKLREVYETSQSADEGAIRSAARAMLASATAFDADGYGAAARGMRFACFG